MFEQSVLPAGRTSTRAAFLAVTAAEIAALAAAAIVPLFLIGLPSVPKLPAVVRFQPRHITLVPTELERTSPRAPVHHPILVNPNIAPSRTPQRVMDLHDVEAPDPGFATSDQPVAAVPGILGPAAIPNTGPPPPAEAPHTQTPASVTRLRVSQGVQEAKLIKKVMPAYPPIARSIRQFGAVHLVAIIGKDGHIRDIQVLSGQAYLVQAAVEAVKQWVYKPTLLNGEPMEVVAPITVNFTLGQ